ILEDNRVVDLRGWANDLHGAVTMTRRVRVLKDNEADEYVIEGRTSGTELIHRCIRPNPQTARLLNLQQEGDLGTQKMKIRRIFIDVRDIPVNTEFEVEVVSTFIGSLLNPEDRWFGVIGYEGAVKITMLMLFPLTRTYEYHKFRIQESRNA